MKKYLLLLSALLLFTVAANAQYYDEKEGAKLSKKEERRKKKEEARRKFEVNKLLGIQMMEKRDFVLLADRISAKTGPAVGVSRNVNYIMISGENMVVQYGINNASVGLNGVGGATLEGKIKKFDVKNRGEGKPYLVTIQFATPYLNGVATVQINIRGDKADAMLNASGRQLNFFGEYASEENSGIMLAKTRGAFN